MWGAYLCMGAYKRNVVFVINMGAYIQVLILCGCLSSRFTVICMGFSLKRVSTADMWSVLGHTSSMCDR